MPKNFQPLIDELRTIIENSRNGRLSPADEQKGATLFKELVMSGGKALSGALELLGDLPWFVPVNGALEAWPQLSPIKQRNFLAAVLYRGQVPDAQRPLLQSRVRFLRSGRAAGLHQRR